MTRYSATLRLRPLPWPIRAVRRFIFRRSGGLHDGMTSAPRRDIWFATLVPHSWRSMHRRRAGRAHFFWLPCPLCSRPFGGHEQDYLSGRSSSVPDPLSAPMWLTICPRCTRAGRGAA